MRNNEPAEKRAKRLVDKLYIRGIITSFNHIEPAEKAIAAEIRKTEREAMNGEAKAIIG